MKSGHKITRATVTRENGGGEVGGRQRMKTLKRASVAHHPAAGQGVAALATVARPLSSVACAIPPDLAVILHSHSLLSLRLPFFLSTPTISFLLVHPRH